MADRESGGRRPSGTTVVAWLALFIALGGAAAGLPGTNSVGSRDVKNGHLKGKDLHHGTVTSKQLKNAGIQQTDVGNDAIGATQLLDGAVTPAKLASVPAVRVDTPQEDPGCATQSVASGGSEVVRWSFEAYDTQSLHEDPPADCSSNSQTRLTAPVDGVYLIDAAIGWSGADTDGMRQLALQLTAGGSPQTIAEDDRLPIAGSGTGQSVSTATRLDAGDFVEVQVAQDSGSALALPDVLSSYFAMTWIAPPPP